MRQSAVIATANYAGGVTDSSDADTADRQTDTDTQRPTLKRARTRRGGVGWGRQRRAGGKKGAGGRKTDGLRTRSRVREREKGRDKGRDADKEAMTGGKREGQAMGGGYYGCGKEWKSCSKWRKVLF